MATSVNQLAKSEDRGGYYKSKPWKSTAAASRPVQPLLVGLLLLLAILMLNACAANPASITPVFTPTSQVSGGDATAATPAMIINTSTKQLSSLSAIAEVTITTTKPTVDEVASTPIPTISPNSPTPSLTSTNTPTFPPPQTTSPGVGVVVNQLVATSGCGRLPSVEPGTSQAQTIAAYPSMARGNVTRSYRLHLPANYKPDQAYPVLLVFHGHGGDAAGTETQTGFSGLADQQHFIVVYPQGLKDDDNLPMWASVGPAADYGIDELVFISDLLNKLQKELCVNAKRIYATGFSNGGGMSNYLACKLEGRIAAVAPIAGNYFALPDGGCQPGRAVSVLVIHGTADNVIAYNGRPNKEYPGWPLPPIPDFLSEWASRNGCAKAAVTFLDTKAVKGQEWTGCKDKTGVVHYQIKGGGHDYPGSIEARPTGEIIWTFFSKHELPTN